MKETKYIVKFQDGSQHGISAYFMAAAVILAQAKQIELGKGILPSEVIEFNSRKDIKSYYPIYHFKAYEKMNKPELQNG